MRKRCFQIIEAAEDRDVISRIYDIGMMVVIVLSLIPITIKNPDTRIRMLDYVTTGIFLVDYVFRWSTADYKLKKGGVSFLLYPFTPMAIIDLLAILPVLTTVSSAFRVFKVLRLLRTFRVFRVFKIVRYSKNMAIIINVFKKQKDSLTMVGVLAFGYILVSAMLIFSIEPETFPTFFDALYWATVSLTTVGYGDIYATSMAGKVITMISALFGIAVVALPAGIVTAGYMNELEQNRDEDDME
jgi:voltage-gated potassium channel